MLTSVLILFIIAVIWNWLKIVTQRAIVYLIVDVIVRSVEYVLFLSMGWMIGLWIIEKEEQLDLNPGWFEPDTSRSIDKENTIPKHGSEYDLWYHGEQEEEDEEEQEEQIIHKTAIPRAFTRQQGPRKFEK
jgi:hypothetical protein